MSDRWATLDPGEDTGWSIWEGIRYVDAGTSRLWTTIDDLERGLLHGEGHFAGVDLIVCEDWALYEWKLKELAWDKCRTARGIGAITLLCRMTGTTFRLQPASIKDRAVAGGAEAYFAHPLRENRHQNDAIMHGIYYAQVTIAGVEDDGTELSQEELDAIRPGEEHYA